MAIAIPAIVLVVVAAVLAGALDDWSGVPLTLATAYLGVLLLSLGSGNVSGTALTAITAIGVEVVLVSPDLSIATLRGLWAARSIRSAFAVRGFHVLGFEVSMTGVAVVGAIGLAVARPVVSGIGVGVVVAVLAFSGLLACLAHRPARLAVGLIFLPLAATLLAESAGSSLPRADLLVALLAQLSLAVTVAHLKTIELARPSERRTATDADSLLESLIQPSAPPRSAEETGS